jgi:hypothetical protein
MPHDERMKSPHMAVLFTIIFLSSLVAVGFLLAAFAAGAAAHSAADAYAASFFYGSIAGTFVGLAALATLAAIVLAGVRHFLNGMLRLQREERVAEREALRQPLPLPSVGASLAAQRLGPPYSNPARPSAGGPR